MPSINTGLFRLVAGLALAEVVRSCAYGEMMGEIGDDMAYRFCAVGCNDKVKYGDPNFGLCCNAASSGQAVPATCTALASSAYAAGVTTCTYTNLPTTASTGKAAPTDYVPGYPTEAAPAPAETSDTAGQSYASSTAPPGSAITTWVTETASADCATEPTAAPTTSTAPASAESTAAPSSANTCACPDPYASSSAAAPETSDTAGQSWSSSSEPIAAPTTEGGATPSYAGSKPDGPLGNLDRRSKPEGQLHNLDRRTDIQYTCGCPAPGASATDTSDTAGESWSSTSAPAGSSAAASSSSAPPAEPTDEDCDDDGNGDTPQDMGDKSTGEVQENQPSKRFIPLSYPIGHPLADKRAYERPPPGFVPDRKRGTPTGEVSESAVAPAPTTVTSTTTITAACSTSAAAPTGEVSGTDSSGGAISGAISGNIGGSSFAATGEVTLPTGDGAGDAYSSSAAPSHAGDKPTEVIDENAAPTK